MRKKMIVFKIIIILVSILANIFLIGCSGGSGEVESSESLPSLSGADGSPSSKEGFHYQTFQHVAVKVMTDYPDILFYVDDENNKNLAIVKTNEVGLLSVDISVSNINKGLYLRSSYVGLPNEVYLNILNEKAEVDLRKNTSSFLNYKIQSALSSVSNKASTQGTNGFPLFSVLGDWNSNGVPDYLVSKEVVPADLMKKINILLPELQPVPQYHPQYLAADVDTDLHLFQTGEVFVTFLHEGAGYTNTLAFYTYKTADGPPQSLNPQDIKIVFPNVSFKFSGGGLESGDTVKLGTFTEGTSIGWVLKSNAYSMRFAAVSNGLNTFYSENRLNPDLAPNNQHFIQIDLGDRVILGVEDLLRPGGDNDFNDAVFSVKSNPPTAIDRTAIVRSTEVTYTPPPPPPAAITLKQTPLFDIGGYQFFPGNGTFGALAFEDLWPHKGDYDFNDLVLDYNVVETLDQSNQIVQVQLSLRVTGIIASMHNSFGIQLGVAPEVVASVSGGQYTKGITFLEPNGTEQRQEKAVIIAFEDAQAHYNSSNPEQSELIVITINFVRGVTREEIGFAPYNPFIMSNGERGREVHLPGYKPTSLVNIPYFGSYDDDSVLGTSYMYRTSNDLPWAIHIPEKFNYPKDEVRISDAYLQFESWISSNGSTSSDWYMSKPFYRNDNLIERK